jgi:FkbM family methyltransferase
LKVIAVIPAYNEEKFIRDLVTRTKKYVDDVIVADDNSTDKTYAYALMAGAKGVTHNTNTRGTGWNTYYGILKALEYGADIVVTLDGDGQHNPDEIPDVIKPILDNQADFVIGSRYKDFVVPLYRRFGISVITFLFNVFSLNKVADSQSGFRAHRSKMFDVIKITERDFSFSVETLVKMRECGFRMKEVPIKCIYHKDLKDNSTASPVKHGTKVALSVIKWRLKKELKFKACAFSLFKSATRPLVGTGLGKIKPLGFTYKLMARSFIPSENKIVEVNGCKLKVRIEKGRDIGGIAQQLVFDHNYEPLATKLFQSLVKEGMTVVDIGANIGYYTLLASKLVGESGKVYAFEPESNNFADLMENINLNHPNNVIPLFKAVSDKLGEAKLFVSENESGEHSLVQCESRKDVHPMPVQTVTLDETVRTADFIKIDVEGHEYNVLEGAERILSNKPTLLIECWPEGILANGITMERFWQYLKNHYEYIYLIDEFQKKFYQTDLIQIMGYYKKHGFSANLICTAKALGNEQEKSII